jgi:hypothetical protein
MAMRLAGGDPVGVLTPASCFAPRGILETLDLQQMAVGVAEKAVVDTELWILGRRLLEYHAPIDELRAARIHVGRHQGQDHAVASGIQIPGVQEGHLRIELGTAHRRATTTRPSSSTIGPT